MAVVVGNTLIDNAADTEDAAIPGPAGINIYSLLPISGNMVVGNSIQNEALDVVVHAPKLPVPSTAILALVGFNSLQGNGVGAANLGAGSTVLAPENFWSCPNGPTIAGSCSTVSGQNVHWGAMDQQCLADLAQLLSQLNRHRRKGRCPHAVPSPSRYMLLKVCVVTPSSRVMVIFTGST